jgi:hypothetical protein
MADKIFDEMYKNKNKMKKDELYHNKYVREGIKPDKKKTDDLAFSLSNFKKREEFIYSFDSVEQE